MTKLADKPINGSLNQQLSYLLSKAHMEVNKKLDTYLEQEGVPIEKWRILEFLYDGEGKSMGQIAENVLLRQSVLTKIVDQMVADALVYRVPDSVDRRKILIFISDRGRELSQRLKKLNQEHQTELSSLLGDQDVDKLTNLLSNLIEKV